MGVGLANYECTGLFELDDDCRICRRDIVLEKPRAGGRAKIRRVKQVFHRNGNASQRIP
jgi:hypothetical protein